VRALKYNGGVPKDELGQENMEALKKGIANLDKHIENIKKYGVPVVVTLNAFITDTQEEYEFIKKRQPQPVLGRIICTLCQRIFQRLNLHRIRLP